MTHRVVVVGGGFGGLPACRFLAREPVDVTLIDRRNHHLFQPLLYHVATGILSTGQIAPPLRQVLPPPRQRARRARRGHWLRPRAPRRDHEEPVPRRGRGALRQPHRGRRGDAVVLRPRGAGGVRARDEDARRRPRAPAPHLRRVRDGRGQHRPRGAAVVADDRDRRRRTDGRGARGPDPRARGAQPAPRLPHLRSGLGPGRAARRGQGAARVVRRPALVTGDAHARGARCGAPHGRAGDRRGPARRRRRDAPTAPSGSRRASRCGPPACRRRRSRRCSPRRPGADTDRSGRIEPLPDLTLPGHPEVFVVGDMVALDELPGVAEVAMQGSLHAANTITRRLRRRARRQAVQVPGSRERRRHRPVPRRSAASAASASAGSRPGSSGSSSTSRS